MPRVNVQKKSRAGKPRSCGRCEEYEREMEDARNAAQEALDGCPL